MKRTATCRPRSPVLRPPRHPLAIVSAVGKSSWPASAAGLDSATIAAACANRAAAARRARGRANRASSARSGAAARILGDDRRPPPVGRRGASAATFATLLGLIPPAATKLTIDNVLAEQPLTGIWTWFVPTGLTRWHLLWWLAGATIVVSLLATGVDLLGRWFATRTWMRLQVATRKRVFEHAVRLPLDRVYQIRSGGVASVLRDDAGSSGELVISMLYNPWRAVVQLAGSLVILVCVDWRLMLGASCCSR